MIFYRYYGNKKMFAEILHLNKITVCILVIISGKVKHFTKFLKKEVLLFLIYDSVFLFDEFLIEKQNHRYFIESNALKD